MKDVCLVEAFLCFLCWELALRASAHRSVPSSTAASSFPEGFLSSTGFLSTRISYPSQLVFSFHARNFQGESEKINLQRGFSEFFFKGMGEVIQLFDIRFFWLISLKSVCFPEEDEILSCIISYQGKMND